MSLEGTMAGIAAAFSFSGVAIALGQARVFVQLCSAGPLADA